MEPAISFNFSVFSKVYFAGLNYYSLKETLKDFLFCVDDIKDIIEIEHIPSLEIAFIEGT